MAKLFFRRPFAEAANLSHSIPPQPKPVCVYFPSPPPAGASGIRKSSHSVTVFCQETGHHCIPSRSASPFRVNFRLEARSQKVTIALNLQVQMLVSVVRTRVCLLPPCLKTQCAKTATGRVGRRFCPDFEEAPTFARHRRPLLSCSSSSLLLPQALYNVQWLILPHYNLLPSRWCKRPLLRCA